MADSVLCYPCAIPVLSRSDLIVATILTQRAVESAKPKAKRYPIADGLVPNQQLLVHPSGEKSYAISPRLHGKTIKITIGDASVLSLAQARAEGKRILAEIALGNDPRAAKQEAARTASETVEVVARDFVERYAKTSNKRRTWQETERLILRNIVPAWGKRPIAGITSRDVVQLLDAVVDRDAATAANRVYTAGQTMFNWARDRHLIEVSPFERVKAPTKETPRDRVLADSELALILQAAETLDYPLRPYFLLLALTGARRQEVAGLRWSELDAALTLWTLPRERAKNGVQHQVPIVPWARSILAELPRFENCDFVLATSAQSSLSSFSRAKRALDAAIATPLAPWRVHDLRRSMATGLARLGVALPVVERLLNHTGRSFAGVAGVYQLFDFADEKRQALESWAQHLLTLGALGSRRRRR
jgi:integrase